MKIKIKDEINDIKLNVTHKELVIIEEALVAYYTSSNKDIENINTILFNRHNFIDEETLNSKIWSMFTKIHKKRSKIKVY